MTIGRNLSVCYPPAERQCPKVTLCRDIAVLTNTCTNYSHAQWDQNRFCRIKRYIGLDQDCRGIRSTAGWNPEKILSEGREASYASDEVLYLPKSVTSSRVSLDLPICRIRYNHASPRIQRLIFISHLRDAALIFMSCMLSMLSQ